MGLANDSSVSNAVVRDLLKASRDKDIGIQTVLQEAHDFEVVNNLFGTGGKRMVQEGGTSLTYKLHLGEDDSAGFYELYDTESPNVVDSLVDVNVPWRHLRGYYVSQHLEVLQNINNALRLANLMKSRRDAAVLSIAEKLKYSVFDSPSSTSDKITPFGLPYWCVPITTGNTAGFNGTYNSTSDTSCAGVASDEARYARFRNWNDRWTHANGTADFVSDDVQKILTAMRYMRFSPPTFIGNLPSSGEIQKAMYTDNTMFELINTYQRYQNDQLGADVARYGNRPLVANTLVNWEDTFDKAAWSWATNPLYIVDWNRFTPFVLKGDEMRESDPMWDRDQPDVFTTYLSMSYNFMCKDRRAGCAVISSVAA